MTARSARSTRTTRITMARFMSSGRLAPAQAASCLQDLIMSVSSWQAVEGQSKGCSGTMTDSDAPVSDVRHASSNAAACAPHILRSFTVSAMIAISNLLRDYDTGMMKLAERPPLCLEQPQSREGRAAVQGRCVSRCSIRLGSRRRTRQGSRCAASARCVAHLIGHCHGLVMHIAVAILRSSQARLAARATIDR